MLEQALAITVGMADTMMVSNAGKAAVSGVSLVDMFNNLVFAVLSALSTLLITIVLSILDNDRLILGQDEMLDEQVIRC